MRTITLFLALSFAQISFAQDRTPSHCHAFAGLEAPSPFVQKARFGDPLPEETVRLSYINHSTFLLETVGKLTVATDFTGYLGSAVHIPTVVTMNHAHETHFTHYPDPRIPHVLRGWGDANGPASHHLDLGEMLVRNVTTDIRSRFGGGIEVDGNSIFVFEVAGLCIGHLGHLHHEPSEEQYAEIGRLDVVMAAVDGGMSVDTETMTRILQRLRSSIVLPMHWRSTYGLTEFMDGMRNNFDVIEFDGNFIEVSLDRLPSRPQVIVLQPETLFNPNNILDD